jgi:hypothetical protein
MAIDRFTRLTRGVPRLSLAVLLAIAASAPAAAQTSGDSRAQGLFGRKIGPPARQTLDTTFVLTEAYDDDVLAEGGPSLTAVKPGGFYSMFQAGGSYARAGRSTSVAVNFASALRYYSELHTVKAAASSLGAGFSTRIGEKTTWTANQSVTYAPSYFYGVFPGASTPGIGDLPSSASPDYTLNTSSSYAYSLSTSVTRSVSQRGSLTGAVDGSYTDFVQQVPGRRDARAYTGRAGYNHNLNRNAVLHVAYRFRSGDVGYASNRSTSEHGLDIGVETSKPLSATRRATFSFTLGSSAVQVPESLAAGGGVVAGDRTTTLYRVSGDVQAGYQFNRTWSARATFRRGLEYVPTLTTPVFANGATAYLGGLLSNRLSLSATASYSTGDSAIRNAATYSTYTGDTRLQFALGRKWAVYGEYLYYYYDFRGTSQLLPGLPPTMTRNGVRLGLTAWMPLLGR